MSAFPKASRLPTPARITEQTWPEGTVPVVTIKCITYQHVNFIRDAIEGFLMQETTFPVEILIHDDASTDGTADIVREYQAKYPQLIRTVLQTENQYSRANKPGKFLNPLVRGEFIALCEGDDYWTSPQKLEVQVGFLEKHPRFVISHHLVSYLDDESGKVVKEFPPPEERWAVATAKELIWTNFIQTCSIVYRRSALKGIDVVKILAGLPLGDWPLCALLCQRGDIAFCDRNMAVYRVHAGNTWYHLPMDVKGAKVQKMYQRMAETLEYRHALPWFRKTADPQLAEFYRTSLGGFLMSYPAACWQLNRRSVEVRSAFLAYTLSLSFLYFFVCLRQCVRRFWSN